VKVQAGRAKRKLEPDTTLLQNDYRPLLRLIDIQQNSQSKFYISKQQQILKQIKEHLSLGVSQIL